MIWFDCYLILWNSWWTVCLYHSTLSVMTIAQYIQSHEWLCMYWARMVIRHTWVCWRWQRPLGLAKYSKRRDVVCPGSEKGRSLRDCGRGRSQNFWCIVELIFADNFEVYSFRDWKFIFKSVWNYLRDLLFTKQFSSRIFLLGVGECSTNIKPASRNNYLPEWLRFCKHATFYCWDLASSRDA